MKIQIQNDEPLTKDYLISLTQDELQKQIDEWLIKKNYKIEGFRPGKAPIAILRSHHGATADYYVKEEIVNKANTKIRKDYGLEKANRPMMDMPEQKDGYSFTLSYDIIPEFPLKDLSKKELETFDIELPKEKIEETIGLDLIKWGKKTPNEGEIVNGNEVLYMMTITNLETNTQLDERMHHAYVGVGQAPLAFIESRLLGHKVNDEFEFEDTFPDDFPGSFKNKKFNFKIKISVVNSIEKPELTDELVKEHGFSDLNDYKKKLKDRVIDDVTSRKLYFYKKRKVLDLLDEEHHFEIPKRLFEKEFDYIWGQFQKEKEAALAKGEEVSELKDKTEEQLKEEYKKVADRRVRLGYIIKAYAAENQITVTNQDLQNAIMNEAWEHKEFAQQIIDMYKKDYSMVESKKSQILEEKVVDHIFAKAPKKDQVVTMGELEKKFEEVLPGLDF